MENLKRAVCEVGLAALSATVFMLFAAAIFAVIVQAFAPSDITISIVNQILKGAGCFIFSLLFVRRDRALFKGMAAGAFSLLLSTLIFGLIGGFRMTAFFLIELILSAVFGGLGALCGGKLRKE